MYPFIAGNYNSFFDHHEYNANTSNKGQENPANRILNSNILCPKNWCPIMTDSPVVGICHKVCHSTLVNVATGRDHGGRGPPL